MKHHARSILFGSLVAVDCQYLFSPSPCGENIWHGTFSLAISLFQKSVTTTSMTVGITEKLQGFDDYDLWFVVVATGILNQCYRINPFEVVENRRSSSCWSFSWREQGHAVGTGTAFPIRLCSRSHGWFGYRCYRYSLCICQSYCSQFDIELKSKNFEFLAFSNRML